MKELLKSLIVLPFLCVALSSLSGCGGTSAPNTATAPSNNAGNGSTAAKSAYPPVPAGVANVELESVDGKMSKVADHKGKLLVLNLWGIWCGPCREEMPHLAQMQKQYGDKGLEVISLNIGDQSLNPEPMENIKKYIEQSKLDYPIARITRDSVAQFYAVSQAQAVPQTFLVDRDMHMRGVWVGGGQSIMNQVQQAIEKTINE